MYCPTDRTRLQTTDRRGVQLQVCPTCRGVWLARSELEKLLESAPTGPSLPPALAGRGDYASVDRGTLAAAAPPASSGLYDRYRNGNLRTQAQSTREQRLVEVLDF